MLSVPPEIIAGLEDFHSRTTRILEAFEVGDREFIAIALDDLAEDIWRTIERLTAVAP